MNHLVGGRVGQKIRDIPMVEDREEGKAPKAKKLLKTKTPKTVD